MVMHGLWCSYSLVPEELHLWRGLACVGVASLTTACSGRLCTRRLVLSVRAIEIGIGVGDFGIDAL